MHSKVRLACAWRAHSHHVRRWRHQRRRVRALRRGARRAGRPAAPRRRHVRAVGRRKERSPVLLGCVGRLRHQRHRLHHSAVPPAALGADSHELRVFSQKRHELDCAVWALSAGFLQVHGKLLCVALSIGAAPQKVHHSLDEGVGFAALRASGRTVTLRNGSVNSGTGGQHCGARQAAQPRQPRRLQRLRRSAQRARRAARVSAAAEHRQRQPQQQHRGSSAVRGQKSGPANDGTSSAVRTVAVVFAE